MGALCCRPIQQNKSPDYDQTTPDNIEEIINHKSPPRYKPINATRSFQEPQAESRRTTWDNSNQNRVNLSDLIHERAQNERRNNQDLEEIRQAFFMSGQGEENFRNSLHNTLPYDGENPPTFQPAHRRSLLRTCKSGDTVLTFGKNMTELESRLQARADGQEISNYSENASPLASPHALLLKKDMSDLLPRKQRNVSIQSDGARKNSREESKESGKLSSQLSSEYFSAKDRFSSEYAH